MSTDPPVYFSAASVAQWCGVTLPAVSNWLRRYTDYPAPAIVYRTPQRDYLGWTADQEEAWREWMKPPARQPDPRGLPRPRPDARPRHGSYPVPVTRPVIRTQNQGKEGPH